MFSKILKYQYNDTPDGQDGLKKLLFTCQWGAAAGGILGLFDIVFYSHVQNFTSKMNVLGAYVVPWVGYSAVFTSTVYMATNLRGKDDKWNYLLGALVLCGVFGMARKNMRDAYALSSIVTPIAIAYKHGEQNGMNIFNPKFVQEGRVHYDFLTGKDLPKSYTKS